MPAEVPQCFVSKTYGIALTDPPAPTPSDLDQRTPRPLARHNLARVGHLRRPLALPHPVPYFALCRELAREWSRLDDIMRRSSISVSRTIPTVADDAHRAIFLEHTIDERPALRARHREGARYILQADVLRFYPSIYTHAIGWAVEGKDVAKANQNDYGLLGNRLDAFSRRMQDGQSLGIPIGPDTSWILAEVVLSAVDVHLQRRSGNLLHGVRAVDDYEFAFHSRADAERALADLQSALLTYELRLNESKTRIVELPDVIDDTWPSTLKSIGMPKEGARISNLVTLFNEAFALARRYPQASVLRYGIAMTIGVSSSDECWWPVYQALLTQCAASEPGTLRYVLAGLARAKELGVELDAEAIRRLCCRLIEQHVPMGHGSEVAWALWLAITLEVSLPAAVVSQVAGLSDPFVPVLALHADDAGLVDDGRLDPGLWRNRIGLDGAEWLVTYEGAIRGWIECDHSVVDDHPVFGWLRRQGVSFFDSNAPVALRRWPRSNPYTDPPLEVAGDGGDSESVEARWGT